MEIQISVNNKIAKQTNDVIPVCGNKDYTVPAGIHNGDGQVQIVLEEKSVTPSGAAQTVAPAAGKVLGKVTVAKIPSNYGDVSGVTAAAGEEKPTPDREEVET